jgi:hypothetical protein
MDAKLRQFIGCRPANTARSSSNKCCQRIGSHLKSPIQILGVVVRNFCLNQYYLTVAVAEATTTNSSRHRSATPLIAVASFWFHMPNRSQSPFAAQTETLQVYPKPHAGGNMVQWVG